MVLVETLDFVFFFHFTEVIEPKLALNSLFLRLKTLVQFFVDKRLLILLPHHLFRFRLRHLLRLTAEKIVKLIQTTLYFNFIFAYV